MKFMTVAILGTTSILALQGAQAQEFGEASAIVIEDAIATVTIVSVDGDAVTVDGADESDHPLIARIEDGVLRLSGAERIDEDAFWHDYMDGKGGLRIGPLRLKTDGYRSIEVRNGKDARFEALLEDYPTVTIGVPAGTDLRFGGSALLLGGDATLGRVEADDNVYVRASLGDADSAKIDLAGGGEIALGDVAGLVDGKLSGSGDLRFGDIGSAVFVLSGSGDIEAGMVAGDAALELRGSGDVTTRDIGGSSSISLRGSGDIETGDISQGLNAELAGSGDIDVATADGPVSLSLRGSGDLNVGGGRATSFEARLSGSGDISYGGVAVAPVLRASGSGDIDVQDAEGSVDARGNGIKVAGRSYDD